jgi:Kef-type K+ transport system membrane component KefB
MIRVVRPLHGSMVVARMRDGMVDERALAVVGAVTIVSALATEAMGLHYIIGAFVTGAVMPVNLRKPRPSVSATLTTTALDRAWIGCRC